MTFVRRNVWQLGGDWSDPVLWYARGVAALKSRPLDDATSWRFYGAIHGIDPGLWRRLGYLLPSDRIPGAPVTSRFWQQCQHGSWYFLPWHRGYVLSFEALVRDAVMKAGGPEDWALPYWNYFKPNESALPPAFASPNWPDGQGDNPLFVAQRYGPYNDGNVHVPVAMINLNALGDPDFTGSGNGGSPGFGGIDTGFAHSGAVHGGVEAQPHDLVHGLVGGEDPATQLPGLMSDPDTAGLDPIFWLHHCNIDRLWEVWRQDRTHADPTDSRWIKGPASIGQRAFSMPLLGGKVWDYVPGDVRDIAKLGYRYDDLSPTIASTVLAQRVQRLGADVAPAGATQGGASVASDKDVELVGASTAPVPIVGSDIHTSVKLDAGVRSKVQSSLSAAPRVAKPDRVFLDLENVRGLSDATALQVYVGLPDGADPAAHPDRLAGSIALFGVRKASATGGEHAGSGLTFVLDISQVVDTLHLGHDLDVDQLGVRIVPVRPVPENAGISIGRISIVRQGG